MTDALAAYRRMTIKIGSALLVDPETGTLRAHWLAALAEDLAGLRAGGHELLIVSSGAIALGRRLLGLSARTLSLEQRQAAAATGQIALSQAWAEALSAHGMTTGQILLTPNITEERRYYLNARTTIATLLSLGAVPIINENDSVATAEIRYGDNDRLSARVATMVEADLLILLSDVDGLYTAPPARNASATHIAEIAAITPAIEAMAGGAASHLSHGGMTTKIEAGRIATQAGTAMMIAKGTETHPIRTLLDGGRRTLFRPAHSRAHARKRWIMGSLAVSGGVSLDSGAVRALLNGKSLLPVGVTRVSGEFQRGDAISIHDPDGREIARGLVGLDSDEARQVRGRKGDVVKQMFGEDTRAELVHRDNLVLLAEHTEEETE